jgi:hypothetical protein
MIDGFSVAGLEGLSPLQMLVTRTLWATAKKLLVEVAFAAIAGIQRRRRLRLGGS